VFALHAQGLSQRQIAEQVFGDSGCRGRVERILRTPAEREPEAATPGLAAVDVDYEALLAQSRDLSGVAALVARYERALLESDEAPELADLERLTRIKRQIEGAAHVEVLRALTAEPRPKPR
jgi:hypothetical protein